MNVIFVVAVGDALCMESEKSMSAATNRWKCDFIQERNRLSPLHPACWKLMIAPYDRALVLDADTVINAECPNPFETFPSDKLTVVTDRQVAHGARDKAELDEWEIVTGKREKPAEYFNTGMMVMSCEQTPFFEEALALCERFPSLTWHDQTPLNVVMSRHPEQLNFVDQTWNFHNPNLRLPDWKKMAKNIYHFPGNPDRLKLIPQVQWK